MGGDVAVPFDEAGLPERVEKVEALFGANADAAISAYCAAARLCATTRWREEFAREECSQEQLPWPR